jgi:DinB superfamily
MSDQAKDVYAAMKRLDDHVQQMAGLFEKFSADELVYKSAPGKWSRKEILGHLIDSGINNLKRFTESQFLPQPYKVIPYRQDDLVLVNQYQQLPLAHLLHLWSGLNQQIIYAVKKIPIDKFRYVIERYDSKEMKSLGWLICDYVDHMEHHLKQL